MKTVLSTSGLVAEDAVVGAVVAVAVLRHICCCGGSIGEVGFAVSVVGGCCPARSGCLGGGPCAFLESGSSAPSLIIISRMSFSAGDAIRTRSFAHLIAVAPCEPPKLLPSTPMNLAGQIQWPFD